MSLSLSALLLFGSLSQAAPVVAPPATTSTTSGATTAVPRLDLCPKECVEDPKQSACKAYASICSFTINGTSQGTTIDRLIDAGGTCGNCEPPPYLRELLGLTGASGDYFTVNTVARVGKAPAEVVLVVARKGSRSAAASSTGGVWLAYSGDLDQDGDTDTFAGPVTVVQSAGITAPLTSLVPRGASTRAESTGRAGGR